MKFHSNIYGWEYVWRDFADSKSGKVLSDPSQDGDPIISMQVPVEGTNTYVSFAPYSLIRNGKGRGPGSSASLQYKPVENFIFHIRTEKGVDQIGKALGMQDIQLGDQDFDKRYLIQGTDLGKVRNLFADMKLRDLILENSLSDLRLASETDELPSEHRVKPGMHAIVYSHDNLLDKFEQLEAVYGILSSVVHRLGVMPALAGVDHEEVEPEIRSESKKLHSPLLDMA